MITEISPNASVQLDGSGNGQVSLTPPPGTVWRLRLANVSTTSTANQPQAFLYRGSSSGPIEQVDSTFLGNSASSGLVAGAPFFHGQVLWAKWTGGDAGAQATLQAYGQQAARGEAGPFDQQAMGQGFPLSVASSFRAGNTIINSAGMFSYSGAPAAGNLVSSTGVALNGTDPHGNAYLAGTTGYFGVGTIAISLLLGKIIAYTAASFAGPWSISGQIDPTIGTGELYLNFSQLISGATTFQLISSAANSIPFSSAGITTVAQVVAALKNVGIFS